MLLDRFPLVTGGNLIRLSRDGSRLNSVAVRLMAGQSTLTVGVIGPR